MATKIGLRLIKRMIGKSNEDFTLTDSEYFGILNDMYFWHEVKVRNLNVVRYKVNK